MGVVSTICMSAIFSISNICSFLNQTEEVDFEQVQLGTCIFNCLPISDWSRFILMRL